MSKHTSGTWIAKIDGPKSRPTCLVITGANARRALAIDCTRSGNHYGEDIANTHLTAAGPGMLDELHRTQDLLFGLLDYFEPGNELDAINAQRERNRAVISKAEGDSNGN